mgnify:CR=1 FL=1|tara:strand:- start:5812 stop:6030 length:219 start_codon:yes stop_codon:yes gene_type:complete
MYAELTRAEVLDLITSKIQDVEDCLDPDNFMTYDATAYIVDQESHAKILDIVEELQDLVELSEDAIDEVNFQ